MTLAFSMYVVVSIICFLILVVLLAHKPEERASMPPPVTMTHWKVYRQSKFDDHKPNHIRSIVDGVLAANRADALSQAAARNHCRPGDKLDVISAFTQKDIAQVIRMHELRSRNMKRASELMEV